MLRALAVDCSTACSAPAVVVAVVVVTQAAIRVQHRRVALPRLADVLPRVTRLHLVDATQLLASQPVAHRLQTAVTPVAAAAVAVADCFRNCSLAEVAAAASRTAATLSRHVVFQHPAVHQLLPNAALRHLAVHQLLRHVELQHPAVHQLLRHAALQHLVDATQLLASQPAAHRLQTAVTPVAAVAVAAADFSPNCSAAVDAAAASRIAATLSRHVVLPHRAVANQLVVHQLLPLADASLLVALLPLVVLQLVGAPAPCAPACGAPAAPSCGCQAAAPAPAPAAVPTAAPTPAEAAPTVPPAPMVDPSATVMKKPRVIKAAFKRTAYKPSFGRWSR